MALSNSDSAMWFQEYSLYGLWFCFCGLFSFVFWLFFCLALHKVIALSRKKSGVYIAWRLQFPELSSTTEKILTLFFSFLFSVLIFFFPLLLKWEGSRKTNHLIFFPFCFS